MEIGPLVIPVILGIFVLIMLVDHVVFPWIGRLFTRERSSSRFEIRVRNGGVTVSGSAFRIAESRMAELIEAQHTGLDSVTLRGTVRKGKIQLSVTEVAGTSPVHLEVVQPLIPLLAEYHVDVAQPADKGHADNGNG